MKNNKMEENGRYENKREKLHGRSSVSIEFYIY